MENIKGFDIKKRELTTEEKNKDIILERFRQFHYDAGEDYLDIVGLTENEEKLFIGFLIAKLPEYSFKLLNYINNFDYFISDLIDDIPELSYNEELDIDMIYKYLAEFINLTSFLKIRTNQILIQVNEYYNSKNK